MVSRRDRAEEVEDLLRTAREEQDEAKLAIETARGALEELRRRESEARQRVSEVRSELASLKRLDEKISESSPLVSKIAHARPDSIAGRLGDVIEAPKDLEDLVERLLASDIEAFILNGASDLEVVASLAMGESSSSGQALLLPKSIDSVPSVDGAAGYRLVERLQVKDGFAPAISALIGHIYVVESLAQALAAPAVPGVLYVTPDGARVTNGGVVRVGEMASQTAGTLERKRRIRELEGLEPDLASAFEHVTHQVEDASAAVEKARSVQGEASGKIARLDGERSSVLSEIGRLEQSLVRILAEAQELLADLASKIADAADELDRVRANDAEAAGKLADAKVRLAQSKERLRSLNARQPELKHRLEGIDRRIRATEQASRSLEVLRLRVDPLHNRYQALSERAMDWAARLRDQASIEEADSASLKKTIEDAKSEVARAKQEVERSTAAVNDSRVARGKLEVQVENAIQAITADGETVLEEALQLPAPTDRAAAERELESLARQINNLGPVNQVAYQEYERLKTRADYVESQLADLESARKALTKITSAIDRKMRRQFLITFEKVDQNFREVFSMLFPGGQAHLEMTDPEHPADTGIEVVAQPRGKRITKMMLMSGGEKSLTALALLFAVYRTRTVPFYVLDEVEAALDDSNLSKLIGAINVLRESTQLLVVSHQRRTMEEADVLYGVSMQADGVSRVVSQKLDRETGKVVNA